MVEYKSEGDKSWAWETLASCFIWGEEIETSNEVLMLFQSYYIFSIFIINWWLQQYVQK